MKIAVIILTVCFSLFSQAQELIELTAEAQAGSELELVAARERILRSAVDGTVERFVKEMIGESKMDRNRSMITQRIFRQSDRFIPFIRATEPKKGPEAGSPWFGTVTMKISLKSLKDLLLKEGLLYLSEGVPVVLPFIETSDRSRAISFRWWTSESISPDPQLKEYAVRLLAALKDELGAKGFFVLDPLGGRLRDLIPEAFRSDSFRKQDLQFIGEFLQSTVVVRGRVVFDREEKTGRGSIIRVNLEGIHTGNDRVVAEVNRTFEVKSGAIDWAVQTNFSNAMAEVTKDLGQQLLDIWQKGTLGALSVRVTINGAMTYQEIESFKKDLVKVAQVKKAVEREFAPDSVSLELDVTGSLDNLGGKLAQLGSAELVLVEATPQKIVLKKKKP